MAIFPNLRPSARTWTPGDWPQTNFQTLGGYDVRVLHGDREVGARLSLQFQNVVESNALAIMAHFRAQQGSQQPFSLPPNVWAGGTEGVATPSGQSWVYAEPPTLNWVRPSVCTVSCTLRSVS